MIIKAKQLKKLPLLLGAFLLPAFIHAAPAISVGDSMDIFFNGNVSVTYDDNLALDESNEISDVKFNFVPGVEIVFGRGQTNGDFRILWQEDFVRYSSEDQFDVTNTTLVGSGAYEGAKFKGSARLAYLERQSNTNSVNIAGNLIRQEIIALNLLGEWDLTAKSSFSLGLNHTETEYVDIAATIIPDRERTGIPINYYYELSPKVDFSIGYTYRDVSVKSVGNNPGYGADDHRIAIGARGEFNPKLSGEISVGYLDRNFDNAQPSRSTLSASGELHWEASPKTRITTRISSDFGIGGSGETVERRGIGVDLNYQVDALWSVTAEAGLENNDYVVSNRTDDLYRIGFGVGYKPNDYVSIAAGYRFTDNDSDLATASYSRNLLHLTASLRY